MNSSNEGEPGEKRLLSKPFEWKTDEAFIVFHRLSKAGSWKAVNSKLILTWDKGYSIEVYPFDSPTRRYAQGTSSNAGPVALEKDFDSLIRSLIWVRILVERCVKAIKSNGDKTALASAKKNYVAAKVKTDVVIARLASTGDRPTRLEYFSLVFDRAKDVRALCDAANLKDKNETMTQIFITDEDLDELDNEMNIVVDVAELEAARWPDFDGISAR